MRRAALLLVLLLAQGCLSGPEEHPEDQLYALMLTAASHQQASEFAEAEQVLHEVLRRVPDSVRARTRLSEVLAARDRPREAARQLREALSWSLAAQKEADGPAAFDEEMRLQMTELALRQGWWRLGASVIEATPGVGDELVLPAIAGLARVAAWPLVDQLLPRAKDPTLLLALAMPWLVGNDVESAAAAGLLPRLEVRDPNPLTWSALAELRLAEGDWRAATTLWRRSLKVFDQPALRARVEALEAALESP